MGLLRPVFVGHRHSHARRTREDHKHEDPFGRPPGHGVDHGSDAPKAELKSSDPIHSNEAGIGSSGGLDALDRLGRAGLGNTDEVVRVLSQVAGRQIVLERWLQQRQQQGEDHEQQQEQQEGEMEVEEELELELEVDVDVDTGMGAGETLGGDSKGEEGDMPEEEGPAVSVESDSEEGWGEEGDEDEDGEQPAAGVAVEGQDRHQTIGQGSRQGYGGSLGGLDTVKSVNAHTVGDGGPAILTRKVRNDGPATSSRRQSKPVPVEEHEDEESKDAMETLRKEDEVSKVSNRLYEYTNTRESVRDSGTVH
ncbi:hypothetical protein QCA50_017510 [Cerrena zonata]|uniref:Uncharacterized protein n=1 Tax=Cerrena zonata TaxID=2478898 RepID=A0AAW0FQ77_9APHY